MKMLTFQNNLVSEAFLMDLVPLSLETFYNSTMVQEVSAILLIKLTC